MRDINTLDAMTTITRLRLLVEEQRHDQLQGLAEEELIDVILCAGAALAALETVLPTGFLHMMLTTPPSFR